MLQRRFGQGGKPVSSVGLGCMNFGGLYGPTTEAESLEVLARALDRGIDFWDTADIYGEGLSERLIGRFLKEDPARRARITLASKFAIRRLPDGKRSFDNSTAYMHDCLDASLRRLGVDHLDLYYVHRYDHRIPIEETVGALSRLVEAGKIGAIGLSEIAPDTLRRAHAVHPIAAVQSEYSLWTRTPEVGLVQACREAGATFVAFSPVGRGFFGGQLRDIDTLGQHDFRRNTPRFSGLNWQRNLGYLDRFLALARRWELAPATVAVAWTLAKGEHIIPIPGTRTTAHLDQHIAAGTITLTPDQVRELETVLPAGFAAGDRYSDQQWLGVERYA